MVISFWPRGRQLLLPTSPLLFPAPDATPGTSSTRSAGLRPFKGSSTILFESTVLLIVADRVSTWPVAASTVTVSCTLPTSSATGTLTFSLAWSRMFRRSYLRNPVCSMLTL